LGLWIQTGRDALLAYRHDGNPVLGRCLGHVVGKADRRGDLYPAKQRPERTTDAAAALMMRSGARWPPMAASRTLATSSAPPLFA
jgi:hypothetical protein